MISLYHHVVVPCDEYVVVKKMCHNDERGKELTRIFIDFFDFRSKSKKGNRLTRASQSLLETFIG